MGKICGVYKITNPIGQVYIGSSINIKRRWKEHKNSFNKGEKTKIALSINDYGASNHTYDILEVCDNLSFREREKYFIKKYIDDKASMLNTYILLSPKKYDGSKYRGRYKGRYYRPRNKDYWDNNKNIIVIDLFTGIYYVSYKEISQHLQISIYRVYNIFNGSTKNKTGLVRA